MAETKATAERPSAFKPQGLPKTIQGLAGEVRELYLGDAVPWVIGYSGGKDSSAVLQLVWNALRELPEEQRKKPVHVISTDTLVEQPLVASWVDNSLARMKVAAGERAAHRPAQAHPGSRRLVLGQPHRQRLPSATAEIPVVHGTVKDPPVEQVHPRRRPSEWRGHPPPRHPQGGEPAAGTGDGEA